MYFVDWSSVALHRIAVVCPFKNRARHVLHIFVTGILQRLVECPRTIADGTVSNDRFLAWKRDHAGSRSRLDSLCTMNVAQLKLSLGPHVEQRRRFAIRILQPVGDLFRRNAPYS